MSWIECGFIITAKDWLFTPPVAGSEFRIRHILTGEPPRGFYGLIAQGNISGTTPELLDVRRLWPSSERQVLRFQAPEAFANQRAIAIRGQRRFITNLQWHIYIDVWVP